MNRAMIGSVLMCGLLAVTVSAADKKEDPREAFKDLQEFIGAWKGNGGPLKAQPKPAELWSETLNWGWKFKGDDAWLVLEFTNGRYFKNGELRYTSKTKKYEFTATDAKGEKQVYQGTFKNNYLTLEYVDPKTKETQRIVMNTALDGGRFVYRFERQAQDSDIIRKEYQVSANKEGVGTGGTTKVKNECVVSGGQGTTQVSYKGESFWVCCSGCRDEFNANPEKYIKEFKAKKK